MANMYSEAFWPGIALPDQLPANDFPYFKSLIKLTATLARENQDHRRIASAGKMAGQQSGYNTMNCFLLSRIFYSIRFEKIAEKPVACRLNPQAAANHGKALLIIEKINYFNWIQ